MWNSTLNPIRDTKRARLIRKLDNLWSEKVREIGYCEYCGSAEALTPHHVFSRSHLNTRWSLDNGVCLCFWCHRKLHDNSNFSKRVITLLKNKRSTEWYEELRMEKNKTPKLTNKDLNNIYEKMLSL